MFKEIMTKLDKHRIRNARMLTVAATLFFAGAVFKITADKWPEGIIYFIAAACFVSLEKAYTGRDKKNDFIAYCGLDCEACEARLATINDDNELRNKVAKEWSELNGVEITPEMINCVGCRIEGVKTPFCDSLCPIRQCALSKDVRTCGDCSVMCECDKLSMITGNNEEALKRLKDFWESYR